jgi:hypothetical protein
LRQQERERAREMTWVMIFFIMTPDYRYREVMETTGPHGFYGNIYDSREACMKDADHRSALALSAGLMVSFDCQPKEKEQGK